MEGLELNELLECISPSIANLQLPDPDLRQFYMDEANRIYRVYGTIDDSLIQLVDMIERCNKEDKDIPVEERRPIKVYIKSWGGNVVPMWTAINAIQMSRTPVWTINRAYAESAGALLLVSGHKRFALKGTQAVFHKGSCCYQGEQSVVESTKKHYDKLDKKIEDFLFSHTKINPKTYNKKASSDIYYDEDACLDNGVVDRVIESFDEII